MSEILDKMGLSIEAENVIKKSNIAKLENGNDASRLGKEIMMGLGIDLVAKLIKSMYKAKTEVKQLISNLTGLTMDEVSKMNLKKIKEFFTELSTHEGFQDFFKQAEE